MPKERTMMSINIFSETKAPTDNAILNLADYKITVNGVTGVFLSDSQKVAIYPIQQSAGNRKKQKSSV